MEEEGKKRRKFIWSNLMWRKHEVDLWLRMEFLNFFLFSLSLVAYNDFCAICLIFLKHNMSLLQCMAHFNWFSLSACLQCGKVLNIETAAACSLISHISLVPTHTPLSPHPVCNINKNRQHNIMQKRKREKNVYEVNFFFIFVAPGFMTSEWTSETACHKILWRAIFTIKCNEVASTLARSF